MLCVNACGNFLSNAYVCLLPFCCGLGPEFGSPPSLVRKKLLTVLSESGKISSIIDDVSIVKRYSSESSHAFPVSSDDEALSKARKEVKVLISCIYFPSSWIFGYILKSLLMFIGGSR